MQDRNGNFFSRFSTRSLVVLMAVSAVIYLAAIDTQIRPQAMTFFLGIITGYFGQMKPRE